ncbi:hypothetical protein AAG906_012956 [Vitis piasezkii]
MDHQVVTIDQFTVAMTSIQEALANLRQEIGSQQSRPPVYLMFQLFGMILRVCWWLVCRPSLGCLTLRDTQALVVLAFIFDSTAQIELEALRQRLDESVSSFISCHQKGIRYNPRLLDMWSGYHSRTLALWFWPYMMLMTRPSRRHQLVLQLLGTHHSYPSQQYRPQTPYQTYDRTYTPPTLSLPYYAAQGMPLSQALRKLTEAGLLTALTPRPPPQPVSPQIRMDLHCAYHQGLGHETDRCTALRHAIQDLINQGLVHLGQPSVTTNPLLAHTTHAISSSTDSMHSIDFAELEDHIHMLIQTPYVDNVHIPDIQYVIREVRTVWQQPPIAARPLKGTSSNEGVRREDDEILRVETTTTPEGLIHMVMAGRATCIVFSDDDLPPKGSDHARPLYISVGCSGRRVPSVLLDNGLALNVCHLATAIAFGYAPSDFGPSTQTVRAYDSTWREVISTLEIELLIGLAIFVTLFQSQGHSFSFYQKVKFIHDGQVITVRSIGDMFISTEPVLHISSSDDDLFMIGFTFDEHGSTVVLDMMRSMSYLPDMGLGRRQHRPSEFMAVPDHDVPFGLGFIPTKADYRYMARLRKERVKARLVDYFMGASEPRCLQMGSLGTQHYSAKLQRLVHQLQLGDGARTLTSTVVAPSSPDHMSCMTFHFPDEIDEYGTFVEIEDIVDGAIPYDEYINEMLSLQDDVIVVDELFDGPVGPDTEVVDFGIANKPRELRIRSDLSTDEMDNLIQLLRSYLDLRRLHPRWSVQVNEEIQKQLSVGFLSVVEYPEWLANVVPVIKKDNKILMASEDMEKTSFIIKWGTYCYRVMPFELKNIGATYQRVATTLFHDMMH